MLSPLTFDDGNCAGRLLVQQHELTLLHSSYVRWNATVSDAAQLQQAKARYYGGQHVSLEL